MKFLFLLWITIRGTFEAAVWATAVWCILYSFTNVLWLQCFWVFIPIHFIWNMSFVEYARTHTKRDCFCYMLIESISVGLSIIHAVIISILPTIAAIVFLSLLEVWTNLETHWLHTWLFVACVVYSLSRRSRKRRMAHTSPVFWFRQINSGKPFPRRSAVPTKFCKPVGEPVQLPGKEAKYFPVLRTLPSSSIPRNDARK